MQLSINTSFIDESTKDVPIILQSWNSVLVINFSINSLLDKSQLLKIQSINDTFINSIEEKSTLLNIHESKVVFSYFNLIFASGFPVIITLYNSPISNSPSVVYGDIFGSTLFILSFLFKSLLFY